MKKIEFSLSFYLKNSSLFNEQVEYNVFLFDEPLKGSKSLKIFKLAWRFVLTSSRIYQNPFTQEKILKLWQCRTGKNHFVYE
jgi:hypothetical protein